MMTWDKHYFDDFDPLTSEASPDHPYFDEADRLLHRARRILNGLTPDEVNQLIKQFDSLQAKYFGEKYHENLGRKHLVDEVTENYQAHHPEIIELQNIKSAFPLTDAPKQWTYLLAIVAINTLAMGLTEYHDNESLFLASEVLALAESQHSSQQVVSDKARASVKAKHKPRNDLKVEFVNWYLKEKDRFHSRSHAAKRFYDQLASDKQRLITKSNAERFFTEALRGHLKNK
ncbi:hypothetical protein [Pseudohongiella nitratireducens]|uniref:hypothetical protein n=1 Tax=Pseudohongiella nitratireducens TaxID=1768907 RepID=UPI0030EDEC4F|tara:strand:+ start:1400 stop:2092 length:693 start_codon:yes stop_codon:yes gene_type:complete